MKRQNHEEVYTSSARRTPRGKRLLSWLLSIVMLLSLLPGMELHVHAAYEDGMECPGCGEYHWDENCCGNCGACTRECDDDCYEETHCINDCGACRADGNFACDCGYCYDCAKELEPDKHCDYCGEEDDGGICSECGLCSECVTDFEDIHCSVCEECIAGGLSMCEREHPSGKESAHCTGESVVCEKCGGCFFEHEGDYCWDCELCQKCALDDNKHCFECGECSSNETPCEKGSDEAGGNIVCESCCESYGHHCSDCYEHINFDDYDGVEGWCSEGGHGTHCSSCADLTRCLQCGHCWECAGLEMCDDCGLCEECCRENTETKRCDHDYCVESSDYEDHLCPDCDECPGDDPCEFCGRCASCAESTHCEHGRCEEDPDYDYEHVCPDCGKCFNSDELCETCELCAECNEHCEEDDICPDNASDWDAHACPACGECPGEKELCATCGLCESCAEHCEHGACKHADDFGQNCECEPCSHENQSVWQSNRYSHWKICSDCQITLERANHRAGDLLKSDAESTAEKDVYINRCVDCGYEMYKVSYPTGEIPSHVHRYDANGYCTVCGSKSDGKPYIIRQPENFNCVIPPHDIKTIQARFSLRAYGAGKLSYQWYDSNGKEIDEVTISGTKTPNLVMTVPDDACKEDYAYYCVVTNEMGSIKSDTVHIKAQHNYRAYYSVDKLDRNGKPITIVLHWENGSTWYGVPVSDVHSVLCAGCGDAKPGAKGEEHTYGGWVIKQKPSAGYSGIKSRTCKVCNYTDYKVFGMHECEYLLKFDDSGHWEECKTCGAKKPLVLTDQEWGTPVYKEAHCYGEYQRTLAPTEDAVGEEIAYCQKEGCTASTTREIKKTPHEHVFYTWDEYIDIASEDKGIWDIKEDAAGDLISACMYTMVDGQKIKVFGADVTYHWYYCKKPSCNEKGVPKAHKMTGWIVDFPPDAVTNGSAKSECQTCGYEVRKAMKAGSYPIVVENGTSYNAKGEMVSGGMIGNTITIKAKQLEGLKFKRWIVRNGGVTIANPSSEESTFTVREIKPSTRSTYVDFIILVEAQYTNCNHNSGTIIGAPLPAGCTSYGKEGDVLCKECGAVITAGKQTEPTGHAAEAEWVVDKKSVKQGDCKHYGNSGNLVCPLCNEIMKLGEKTTREHGSTTLSGYVAPTCTKRGYSGDKICTICDKVAERGSPVEKSAHTFSEWTPIKEGGTKYMRECSVCGAREFRDGPASGTAVESVTLAPNTLTLSVGMSGTLAATVLPEEATNRNVTWTSDDPNIATVDENGNVTAVKAGKTTITVTTEDGNRKASCAVTVTANAAQKELAGIRITTPPKKTTYIEGESFDKTGMTVYAVYKDHSREIVTNYTCSPTDALKTTDTEITVSYTEGGVTVQAAQQIKVKSSSEIRVAKPAITPPSCSFTGMLKVSIKAEEGTTIYFTTNGSNPTTDSSKYTGEFTVSKSCTIKAIAVKNGVASPVASASYTTTNAASGGHTPTYGITIQDSKNGDVTASHKSAAKGTTVTLTVNPDKGYVLDTLTVLDGKDKELKITDKGDGKFTFTMPDSKVTVEATFKTAGNNPFTDVPAGAYYEDAVVWAVGKNITTGMSATTFDPNGSCTRAQIVTFLWRAAGSPAAKSSAMPFADVKAGSYYYDAVLWAVEQGITKGTSDTMFSPDATCTRAQIVTFLWRSQKSPAAGMANPFADVAADTYYIDAVLWAVKHNITVGTTFSIFSPDEECTRAQIVTFLYRAHNK